MQRRQHPKGENWTPYGHEKARRQMLMQRHAWLAVAALAVAMFYGIFLSVTFTVETDVDSGRTVEVRQQEQKPMTVTVTPGRAPGFADGQLQEPQGIEAPSSQRHDDGLIMSTLRPFLPVVAPLVGALWLLSRVGASARGQLAELNFGVYKGAMPYEMHTAKRYKQVFTHRQVESHIFGKTREDFLMGAYLDDPPISIRRLLGSVDVEEADITRLRHGAKRAPGRRSPAAHGAQGASRSPSSVAGGFGARLRDAWDEEGWHGLAQTVRRERERRQRLRERLKKAHMLNQARRREQAADSS